MTTKNSQAELATDNKAVQFLLRAGLGIAVILMIAGLVVSLSSGETIPVAVEIRSLLSDSLSTGNRLMGCGVLVLGLTPVFRVLMLICLWAHEKDWKFAGIALIVFITLCFSISLGTG